MSGLQSGIFFVPLMPSRFDHRTTSRNEITRNDAFGIRSRGLFQAAAAEVLVKAVSRDQFVVLTDVRDQP